MCRQRAWQRWKCQILMYFSFFKATLTAASALVESVRQNQLTESHTQIDLGFIILVLFRASHKKVNDVTCHKRQGSGFDIQHRWQHRWHCVASSWRRRGFSSTPVVIRQRHAGRFSADVWNETEIEISSYVSDDLVLWTGKLTLNYSHNCDQSCDGNVQDGVAKIYQNVATLPPQPRLIMDSAKSNDSHIALGRCGW